MSTTFDYACTDCGTTAPVHEIGCEWEGTDPSRFEKAYIDILSIITLPQFEGVPYPDLVAEVDDMTDEGWTRLHTRCYNRLKRRGRVEVDSEGRVYHVPAPEREGLLVDNPTKSRISDALYSIDPDVEEPVWFSLARSVRDWNDGEEGKQLFESWSKQGSKWDRDAKRTIRRVWSEGTGDLDKALGRLANVAMDHGWSP